jgi:hypothetical protein
METYPLTKVKFLKLRQSDAFGAANWKNPKETDSGLQLRRGRRFLHEENAEKLLCILEAELKHESLVFTHNPWGEYGNEEHVQVFRILTRLKQKLGFDLFVSSYVGATTVKLMSTYAHLLDGKPLVCETDRALAHGLKNLYLENDCWTWAADYAWPEYECFYRVRRPNEMLGTSISTGLPLNYITNTVDRIALSKFASRTLRIKSVRSHFKRAYIVSKLL